MRVFIRQFDFPGGGEIFVDDEGEFERRPLICVDTAGYGKNDDKHQSQLQRSLVSILDEAGTMSGLDRSQWITQSSGDGELAILPAGTSEARVIDGYVRAVYNGLVGHNYQLDRAHRIRLRMAIHHGMVRKAANGYAGQGVVAASRLADCDALKLALAMSSTDLVVIVSGQVYRDRVVQRHTALGALDFREIHVRNKEYVESAWLYVPGGDVHAIDLSVLEQSTPRAAAPGSRLPDDTANPHIEFHGPVTTGNDTTIGIRF